jgi:hypothetical protein
MDSKTLDCIVCDAGAHSIRAGRAEDFPADTETPHIVVPSCVSTAGDVEAGQAAIESVKYVSTLLLTAFISAPAWHVGHGLMPLSELI